MILTRFPEKQIFIKPCKMLLAIVLFWGFSAGWAAEEGNEEQREKAQYIEVKPSIIANFVSDNIRFVKVDVAVKVRGQATANAVELHMPRIKHNLLMLLSRQNEEALVSQEGQSIVREEALEEIVAVLEEEGAEANVEEVLFTGLLVE